MFPQPFKSIVIAVFVAFAALIIVMGTLRIRDDVSQLQKAVKEHQDLQQQIGEGR